MILQRQKENGENVINILLNGHSRKVFLLYIPHWHMESRLFKASGSLI